VANPSIKTVALAADRDMLITAGHVISAGSGAFDAGQLGWQSSVRVDCRNQQ